MKLLDAEIEKIADAVTAYTLALIASQSKPVIEEQTLRDGAVFRRIVIAEVAANLTKHLAMNLRGD